MAVKTVTLTLKDGKIVANPDPVKLMVREDTLEIDNQTGIKLDIDLPDIFVGNSMPGVGQGKMPKKNFKRQYNYTFNPQGDAPGNDRATIIVDPDDEK